MHSDAARICHVSWAPGRACRLTGTGGARTRAAVREPARRVAAAAAGSRGGVRQPLSLAARSRRPPERPLLAVSPRAPSPSCLPVSCTVAPFAIASVRARQGVVARWLSTIVHRARASALPPATRWSPRPRPGCH